MTSEMTPTAQTVAPPHDLIANTIRTLSMDAVQKANSGHPGMPMGMADVGVVLWTKFLKFNAADPLWPDRDRFVLSAGHGSMFLYSLLYLTGYDLSLGELKNFRQWDSHTPGHPERGWTPGVETTTGPLGQGISNAVGMALAERWLATHFNRPGFEVVDHTTYVIASDGDLMEGVSHEAASLAGHLRLGKLVVLYDDNHISIDGSTQLAFTEDVLKRFEAYGWHTDRVDGHDPAAVEAAIHAARAETSRPSLIACRTTIGFGSPNRGGTSKAHGEPLGVDEVRLTKEKLGWPPDAQFYVPDEVLAYMREVGHQGAAVEAGWQERMNGYGAAHPDLAAEFQRVMANELPDGWDKDLPTFGTEKAIATRQASGAVLNALSKRIPNLIGGSGDLTPSNNTLPEGEKSITPDDFSGRYIRFGVREHGMGSIMNGIAAHGGLRPYGGTFLVFSDYMRPTIRLAAMMALPVIYIFTHDSIGLGEDGPTHQPIEHLAALRVIPDLVVFRPADANETRIGWEVALKRSDRPTALILTRQGLPVLDRTQVAPAENAGQGGYVLVDAETPQVILIASGSEVEIALGAHQLLSEQGLRVRVVSMPSTELFDMQPQAYRDSVLPPSVRARVAVEAAAPMNWWKYVGLDGVVIGLTHFGASAPYKTVYKEFGLTPEKVAEAARGVLGG